MGRRFAGRGSRHESEASAGTDGAAQCFLVSHQVSQEVTAARLRFQVAGALAPHSSVSAVPISASVCAGLE